MWVIREISRVRCSPTSVQLVAVRSSNRRARAPRDHGGIGLATVATGFSHVSPMSRRCCTPAMDPLTNAKTLIYNHDVRQAARVLTPWRVVFHATKLSRRVAFFTPISKKYAFLPAPAGARRRGGARTTLRAPHRILLSPARNPLPRKQPRLPACQIVRSLIADSAM